MVQIFLALCLFVHSNKSYLKPSEFLPYASDKEDEEVRIIHQDCDGGFPDHKCRLYIRRKDNARVVAYCHNCGKRGSASVDNHTSIQYQEPDKSHTQQNFTNTYHTYELSTQVSRYFNPIAATWLNKYRVTQELIDKGKIRYDTTDNCLMFPVHNIMGNNTGFILRYFGNQYIRYKRVGENGCHYFHDEFSDSVLIVEDFISSLVASGICNTVALLGTNLSEEDFNTIVSNYSSYIIWLDNDSATIKEKARAYWKRFSLYGKSHVVLDKSDPKKYSKEEICTVLKQFAD